MITPKELVGLLPPTFDPDYIDGAVVPYLLSSQYAGERPALPLIDLALSKENAAPPHFWGMLYDGWAPNPEEEGVTVFIQGYERRGPDNERKKIYASATTPDLYAAKYAGKVRRFLARLFDDANAGQPLMQKYYADYFDLYWDLHLGVTGEAIPVEVRQIGASFTAVLGHWFPTSEVVHENFMRVRELRPVLTKWIDLRVQAVIDGDVPDPEATFVHYWLENGGGGEHFRRKDIVFECFHNFLAFSQWGNTVYNIMALLAPGHGDPQVRSRFAQTMADGPDETDGGAFTPLDRFVMELFRTISPNAGSLSTVATQRGLQPREGAVVTPHPTTSRDPRHWLDPETFDPDRYTAAPTSADNDETRSKEVGLARCPFPPAPFAVRDGRRAELTNSAFGAVYGVVDGTPYPVCDAAGYAPFGFGYRRCGGEHVTVEFVKEFLRTVWRDGIEFVRLDLEQPAKIPVSPRTVIDDNIGFQRAQRRPEDDSSGQLGGSPSYVELRLR
jgi:cytochrome P450